MTRSNKKPMRQWVAVVNVKFNGALAFLEAETAEAALALANEGEWADLDTTTAELIDWQVKKVEPNE